MSKIVAMDEIFETVDFAEVVKTIVDKINLEDNRINGMLKLNFINYEAKEHIITYEVPVFDWQLNPNGVMHGGISATIMDTTLGIFANAVCAQLGGYFSPTINMNINYLAPVPSDKKIIVKAQLISSNRSLITLNGEIKTEENHNIAVFATASYKVMRK